MSLKIFGGLYQGKIILLDRKINYRPTSILLRRKIFDRFQNLSDHHFIDLCCGSGAMGLEALSRGAKSVTFNDQQKININQLKLNVAKIVNSKFGHDIYFMQKNFLDIINQLEKLQYLNDGLPIILYFDPPYEEIDLYQNFCQSINTLKKLHPNLIIWIESSGVKGLQLDTILSSFTSFSKMSSYHHSDNFIIVLLPTSQTEIEE